VFTPGLRTGRSTETNRIPKRIELEKRGEPVFVAIPELGNKKKDLPALIAFFLSQNGYFITL